jgi:hypothetical protein
MKNRTLKGIHISMAGHRLFGVFPDLENACISAVEFVGMNFPGEAKPLIHEMIANAFTRYEKSRRKELDPRVEFIFGLCERAEFLYRIRYTSTDANGRVVVWTPMVQPVTEFESAHKEITVVDEPDPQFVSRESAQMQFGARILPGHLFTEVFKQKKANYVEA